MSATVASFTICPRSKSVSAALVIAPRSINVPAVIGEVEESFVLESPSATAP